MSIQSFTMTQFLRLLKSNSMIGLSSSSFTMTQFLRLLKFRDISRSLKWVLQ